MRSNILRATAAAAAFIALSGGPAVAQRQQPTPEQRIERMERQLQQVQRQVFPRGRPAETAGFSDEPAATQASVLGLDQRLGGLERQLADTLRQAEENGNRVRQLEAELTRLRGDQERRLVALETVAAAAATAPPAATITPLQPAATAQPPRTGTATPPRTGSVSPPRTGGTSGANAAPVAADDPAEIAYDEGFQLWRAGRFDEALTSLRAFSSAYPRHRRTSWANNLAGRALLDKGEPRAAAEALLANYRTNPSGERAADSLFYLGQSLMKLGQPGQACNAYSELEGVFGAKMRDELKRLLPPAKVEAKCS